MLYEWKPERTQETAREPEVGSPESRQELARTLAQAEAERRAKQGLRALAIDIRAASLLKGFTKSTRSDADRRLKWNRQEYEKH